MISVLIIWGVCLFCVFVAIHLEGSVYDYLDHYDVWLLLICIAILAPLSYLGIMYMVHKDAIKNNSISKGN